MTAGQKMSKKHQRKKSPDAPLLSPEEAARLSCLLENLSSIDLADIKGQVSSPQFAQAFLRDLPSDAPGAADLVLAVMQAYDHKEVQRAAKKAIFRLKQRGVSVQEVGLRDSPPTLLQKVEQGAEPDAYLGPVDGFGNRAVLLAIPQIPAGVDLGMGAINDEKGIVNFLFGRYSKKRMRGHREIFFEKVGHMVETSLSHVATLLEAAYARSEPGLDSSSGDYLQLRPWLTENVPLLDRPAIYDLVPPESISSEVLTESQIRKLFEHPLMETWIIDPETIKPLVGELIKAEESRLFISEAQKTSRINEIKETGAAEIYSAERRVLLKGRLEEMAYVFFKLKEDNHARLSLSAASSLDRKDSLLRTNPLLKAMVDRSLAYYLSAAGGKEGGKSESASSSRLILP
jgi:hypothetical protein